MKKHIVTITCVIMAVAVGLGAFGAHALKDVLTTDQLVVWKTATFYHFIHGLALLVLSIVYQLRPSKWLWTSIISLLVGIILFSGSLYLLTTMGWRWLGPVTPIGGLAFILGWIFAIFGLKESLQNAQIR
ncbi:MAG: DUF423 domain-containing protein [Bacteroidetes bacterium]|nr:MAG: DUF423 domain-containing protein [Bacteroidota bacterium]